MHDCLKMQESHAKKSIAMECRQELHVENEAEQFYKYGR